jgi:hypothetical protein
MTRRNDRNHPLMFARTMKDVAIQAGVSQSTVSFVLNGQ